MSLHERLKRIEQKNAELEQRIESLYQALGAVADSLETEAEVEVDPEGRAPLLDLDGESVGSDRDQTQSLG